MQRTPFTIVSCLQMKIACSLDLGEKLEMCSKGFLRTSFDGVRPPKSFPPTIPLFSTSHHLLPSTKRQSQNYGRDICYTFSLLNLLSIYLSTKHFTDSHLANLTDLASKSLQCISASQIITGVTRMPPRKNPRGNSWNAKLGLPVLRIVPLMAHLPTVCRNGRCVMYNPNEMSPK